MKRNASLWTAMAAAWVLAACNRPTDEPAQAPAMVEPAPAAEPASTPTETVPPQTSPDAASANDATPAFVGKVWEVKTSSAVEPGTQYSFLADGTLVIASKNGPPGYGKWTYENGALTMVEEGISYPTDILKLDNGAFEIRSHNPGEPVTIGLIPVPDAPLPAGPGG